MNERCDKHNITRCPICASLSSKKPGSFVPAAPSEITGAPPADIEQMDADALRAVIDDANSAKVFTDNRVPHTWVESELKHPFVISPGQFAAGMAKETFDTLPVDDSHASKVVRAAAAYATASKDWAQNLARVEKIKSELLKAEALLHEALVAKETSECDLKTLVTG